MFININLKCLQCTTLKKNHWMNEINWWTFRHLEISLLMYPFARQAFHWGHPKGKKLVLVWIRQFRTPSINAQLNADQCRLKIWHWSQCRSIPINADQFRSIPLDAVQHWSAMISIERHFGLCHDFDRHWSALIGIGHWSGESWIVHQKDAWTYAWSVANCFKTTFQCGSWYTSEACWSQKIAPHDQFWKYLSNTIFGKQASGGRLWNNDFKMLHLMHVQSPCTIIS